MDTQGTRSGFAAGVFVGVLVGLAIGFLYAPRRGAETRKLVKEKIQGVTEKVTGVIDQAQESAARAKYRKKWAEQQVR